MTMAGPTLGRALKWNAKARHYNSILWPSSTRAAVFVLGKRNPRTGGNRRGAETEE
jgi:hypothetical protein